MATVGFLVHAARPEAIEMASDTAKWLGARSDRARVWHLIDSEWAREVSSPEDDDVEPLTHVDLSNVDIAVSLGGDGTFLRLVGLASPYGIPLLGVNFGRLGYLLPTAPSELHDVLDEALAGKVAIDERALLEVTWSGEVTWSDARGGPAASPERADPDADTGPRSEGVVSRGRHLNPLPTRPCRWLVLNEVVLEKTVPGHTVELAASVNGEQFASYRADGILVATPTGSTAYNLSAGGPAVAPSLAALVVTPVAPHLAIGTSVVLGGTCQVTLQVHGGRPAVAVMDGMPVGLVPPGGQLSCRLADHPARLVVHRYAGLAASLSAVLSPARLS